MYESLTFTPQRFNSKGDALVRILEDPLEKISSHTLNSLIKIWAIELNHTIDVFIHIVEYECTCIIVFASERRRSTFRKSKAGRKEGRNARQLQLSNYTSRCHSIFSKYNPSVKILQSILSFNGCRLYHLSIYCNQHFITILHFLSFALLSFTHFSTITMKQMY